MPIYSVADLKSKYLNITGNAEDTALTELADLANGYIKTICRQPIEQETVTRYVIGKGEIYLALPYTVPVTLTSCKERSDPSEAFVTSPVTPTVFTGDAGQKYLYLPNGFSSPFYELTLSVGYASDYPEEIRLVFAEMVKELRSYSGFASEGDRFGVESQSQNVGGFSTTTKYKSLENRWRRLLSRFIFWG